MNRNQNLQRLQTEMFDLCIIGGGASGAGCALDAALRGLKVALIEKSDFAAGTSSKSTKLVHGGVRYLEQAFKNFDFAQLRQVRHGLEERHIVLQNAPHLAQPLALITPVFSWWEKLYFSIGLTLYDWFASGKDTLPKSRQLSKTETLRLLPGLSTRISGAVLYYDGQMDDARYCLALAQSAAEAGAAVVNYVEVIDFKKDKNGRLDAAIAASRAPAAPEGTPVTPFEIRSRVFLNCSGVHTDQVRRLANPALPPRIRPSKGVHVVLPRQTLGHGNEALLIPKTRDGRMVFAVPFENGLLLGTTDNDYSELDKEPSLESGETEFLLEALQPFLRQKIDKSQIKAGFGGLRPLIQSSPPQGLQPSNLPTFKPSKSLVRDHEVEHDPASNLLSLLGGKWTTYRLMAKDAVNAACALLDIRAVCRTENHLLSGARNWSPDLWKKIQAEYGLETDISQHLARKYGARAHEVAALAQGEPGLSKRLLTGHPFLKAEVVYAVRAEMALYVRDFLARRIRLESTDWQAAQDAATTVAGAMARELGWTKAEQTRQVETYLAMLQEFRETAGLPSSKL